MKFAAAILFILFAAGPNTAFGGTTDSDSITRRKFRDIESAECVTYLKIVTLKNGRSKESWSCEFSPEAAERLGGLRMFEIKGISKDKLDSMGAISGETTLRFDSSASVGYERGRKATTLHIPKKSKFAIELIDKEIEIRHARNRQLLRHRYGNPAPSTGILKTLVVRVTDGNDVAPILDAAKIEGGIFLNSVCLRSRYVACSYNQFVIQQPTEPEFSTTVNGTIVNGVVEVNISLVAANSDKEEIQAAARIAAETRYGGGKALSEIFDLVLYCQPPGTDKFLGSAYMNGYESFYYNEWCGSLSMLMHAVGHNLSLADSGKDGHKLDDKSGVMGYPYKEEDAPMQCFNPAKSYQLGWYSEQVQSIKANSLATGPRQNFLLNGIADYKSDGSNGDSLVSLRIEYQGVDGGFDYYIGYNRKTGINSGTRAAADKVVLLVKLNKYAPNMGDNFYGQSYRLATMEAGESYSLVLHNDGAFNFITVQVNSISGKEASITLSGPAAPDTAFPTHLPTDPPTIYPSKTPTFPPTVSPTAFPTSLPTVSPSKFPTNLPSVVPSSTPSNVPSDSPSSIPSEFCTDDADFRLNSLQDFSCEWVAKRRTKKRCELVHKRSKSRQKVSSYCRATCDQGCNDEVQTKSRCKDADGFAYKGDPTKDCDWVGRVPKRCKKKDKLSGVTVKEVCPSVCDARCSCRDSNGMFRIKGKRSSCINVHRKKDCSSSAGATGRQSVADFCPKTCGDCYKRNE